MTTFKPIPDPKNSTIKLVVHFFSDETKKETVSRNFYSKWQNKPEQPNPLGRMRAKAHEFRGNTHGYPFVWGYRNAQLFMNQKPGRPEIMRIDAQGTEVDFEKRKEGAV